MRVSKTNERKTLRKFLYRVYERQLLADVRGKPLPRHLGLIQDGHRRYVRESGLSTVMDGYRLGIRRGSIRPRRCLVLSTEPAGSRSAPDATRTDDTRPPTGLVTHLL